MTQQLLFLDADILAYEAAAVSQRTYKFDPDDPSVVLDEWDEVTPRIDATVEKWCRLAGGGQPVVALSCPTPEGWRKAILPSYKENRDPAAKPHYLGPVKDYLEAQYPAYRRPSLEADDIMGILSTMGALPKSLLEQLPKGAWAKARRVIVSSDKDMKTIPGWLFNPAKDRQPRLVDQAEADYWHLYQTLVGDTTDNYKGCPGVGPVKAEQLLKAKPGLSVRDLFALVELMFVTKGKTPEDALVQARVARICRASDYDFTNKEVILWTPH